MPESISFQEAEAIIRTHGPTFAQRGVVGVGIAARNNKLRFIVAVKDESTRERLRTRYQSLKVEDRYPVYVEVGNVATLHADAHDQAVFAPRPRVSLMQELMDRPGFLILGSAVLIALVMWRLSE